MKDILKKLKKSGLSSLTEEEKNIAIKAFDEAFARDIKPWVDSFQKGRTKNTQKTTKSL